MIRKLSFLALLIAIASATFAYQPYQPYQPPVLPPVQQNPSPNCYFDQNNLIVNGEF
jgi:hypothetical protein